MKKRILVLAPHPDDAEFGCGGTIHKYIQTGHEVYYAAFSSCVKSIPTGFEKETLFNELKSACKVLGVKEKTILKYDIPVREFPKYRQEILEEMVRLKKEVEPTTVLTPNSNDFHQDHEVVHNESIRAFKHCSILGYELPWNCNEFTNSYFSVLSEENLSAKIKAIKQYNSQKFREYHSPAFFTSLATVRGTQINTKYAEAFECIRWIV